MIESIKPEDRERNIEGVLFSFLIRLSHEKPLIIAIDDAQYMDESSLSFFRNFNRFVGGNPIMIILMSWVPLDKFDGDYRVIQLNPLSKQEVKDLLKILFDNRDIEEELLNMIYNLTRGNSLFVEEIIENLKLEDLFEVGKVVGLKKSKIDVPDKIYDIVLSRIDRLEEMEKNFIKRASVVGFHFTDLLLKEAWGNGVMDEIVNNLEDEDFIRYFEDVSFKDRKAKVYSFKNEIFKDVSYSLILKEERKKLHRTTAVAIENLYKDNIEQQLDKIAYHYWEAEDDRASEYLYLSANRKFKGFRLKEAIEDYNKYLVIAEKKALQTDKQSDEFKQLLNVYNNLGEIYVYGGKNKLAMSYFNKVEDLTDDEITKITMRRNIGDCYLRRSKYKEALGILKDLIEETKVLKEPEDEEKRKEFYTELAKIYVDLAWVNYRVGNHTDTEKYSEQALQLLEGLPIEEDVELTKAEAYKIIGAVSRIKQNIEKSYEYDKKALAIYQNYENLKGIATIYNNIISYYDEKSDYLTAIKYLKKSLELDEKIGDLLNEAIGRLNLGLEYCYLGDFKTAKDYIDSYQKINKLINNKVGYGWANEAYSDIYSKLGKFDKALSHINKSIEIFEQLGSIRKVIEAKTGKTSILLDMENFGDAEKICDEIEPLIYKYDILYLENDIRIFKANIALNKGEYNVAETYLKELMNYYEKQNKQDRLIYVYHLYKILYENKGDSEKAIEYRMKANNSLDKFLESLDDAKFRDSFVEKHSIQRILNE
jgi:predicted ATPase